MITTPTLFIKAPSPDLAWDLANLTLSADSDVSNWAKTYAHESEGAARTGEHAHPEGALYRIDRSAVKVAMEGEHGPAEGCQAFIWSTPDHLWSKVDIRNGNPVFDWLAWTYVTAAEAFQRQRDSIEYEGREAVKDFGVYLLSWSITLVDSSS